MMKSKSGHSYILILEDDKVTREALARYLREWGLLVLEAATIAEAMAQEYDSDGREVDIAVAVLDEELNGDPSGNAYLGSQYGQELRRSRRLNNPPEFIIYSGAGRYKEALDLEVAVFFEKTMNLRKEEIAQHVCALVLRRKLRMLDPPSFEDVVEMARRPLHGGDAIIMYCSIVLLPLVQSALPAPVSLLVSEVRDQRKRLFLCSRGGEVALISDSRLSTAGLEISSSAGNLPGGTRVPMAEYTTEGGVRYRVTLLIGNFEISRPGFPEDAAGLGQAIFRHCRDSVALRIFELGSLLSTAIERQRLLRRNTGDLLLKVGQRLLYQLQEYHSSRTEVDRLAHLESLEEFALSLRDRGELLEELGRPAQARGTGRWSVARALKESWEQLDARSDSSLEVEADSYAWCDKEGLRLAFLEVASWFESQHRLGDCPLRLIVRASEVGDEISLDLRDSGNLGLPHRMRRVLEPSAAPLEDFRINAQTELHMARIILLLQLGGTMEDRSDATPGSCYRFVMRIPNPRPAVAEIA